MTPEHQKLFYASLGKELTKIRERKKLSTYQLAKQVGEQYNTVKGIEDGKPFMFHQAIWLKDILNINLGILISDCYEINNIPRQGSDSGEEEIKIEDLI
jgi:transcriptional regulator with XRE-family HTH domain